MAGEFGGGGRCQVSRIRADGLDVTAEDVWNAAIRAGADPARLALSLCHVVGEHLAECDDAEEAEAVPIRYVLRSGREVEYDATLHNPFNDPAVR